MRHYIITILIALTLAACGGEDEPKPVPGPVPETTPRTVLVYIAANNNLGSGPVRYDLKDIAEMEEAVADGALNGGRLLVYHAPYDEKPALKEVTPKGTVTLKEYDDGVSSVAMTSMRRTFDDMKELAPADDYGLVLWSHASGWIDYGKSPENNMLKSWGIDGSYQMSIPDLGRVLRDADFSFIYFDCCFMGNIESLYELRGAADYIVASPAETPLDGMPYDLNVECFFKDIPDLRQAAINTFDTYNAMSGSNRSCTMALYDMSEIESVAHATRAILEANGTAVPGDVQQYGTGYSFSNRFYDLGHYMESLNADAELVDYFNKAMERFVLYNANTPQMALSSPAITLNNCHGVSCYIVVTREGEVSVPARYDELRWWTDVVVPAFGLLN